MGYSARARFQVDGTGGARVLVHEVKLVVVVGLGYWRRRAASESGWRPRRRAAVAAPDVEVGSVLLERVHAVSVAAQCL